MHPSAVHCFVVVSEKRARVKGSRGETELTTIYSPDVLFSSLATSNSVKPHLLISCRSFLNGLVVELLMADPAEPMENLSEAIAAEANIAPAGQLGVDNNSTSSAGILKNNTNKSRFVVIRQSNGASSDPPLQHESEGECIYVRA